MLGRLGLVIHFLGWAASIVTLVWGVMNYKTYYTACLDDRGNASYVDCGYRIETDVIFMSLIIAAAFIVTGWAIHFILAGHKNPLPWVANKETEQCQDF
jgi:hypothetical protein